MRLDSRVVTSLFFVAVSACQGEASAPAEVAASPAPAAVPAAPPTTVRVGAGLSNQPPVALQAVLESPDAFANRTVLVDGTVRKTCTAKGCWMELAPAGVDKAQGCRVTFKDYGFFVPTDSAGATARVEGVVSVSTVAKDEVTHLESEGASFAKKFPDGSAREVRIVASGVELTRGG
jgi:hypothetical protein